MGQYPADLSYCATLVVWVKNIDLGSLATLQAKNFGYDYEDSVSYPQVLRTDINMIQKATFSAAFDVFGKWGGYGANVKLVAFRNPMETYVSLNSKDWKEKSGGFRRKMLVKDHWFHRNVVQRNNDNNMTGVLFFDDFIHHFDKAMALLGRMGLAPLVKHLQHMTIFPDKFQQQNKDELAKVRADEMLTRCWQVLARCWHATKTSWPKCVLLAPPGLLSLARA